MSDLLPPPAQPRITQSTGPFSAQDLASTDILLLITAERPGASVWRSIPAGAQLKKAIKKRKINNLAAQARLKNKANTAVYLAQLPGSGNGESSVPSFALLSFAGKLAGLALADNPRSISISAPGIADDQAAALINSVVAALLAHRFSLPTFKSKPPKSPALKQIRAVGLPHRIDFTRTVVETRANNLARWLTALPPNKLDAKGYRRAIEQLSAKHGWKYKFLDEKRLSKLGAGAFLAVSQGNANRDAGIVHLSYRPKLKNTKRTQPDVALVGKGIIFDTGGTNLKPFKAMLDMHHDMAGSAVALATLTALSELEAPVAVDCWLAITENRLSNDAYKSRDIVTASNGISIEIIHTDAEGRMALADTLALAGKEKPAAILDFATLTGTCVAALTDRYSGAFSNRISLNEIIVKAGQDSGERVWPFPLDADFADDINSDMADILQCSTSGGGDHIQAAKFLQRFVPEKSAWVHVDLSAATRTGGLAHIPTTVTGFGVRFALSLIMDHQNDLLTATED